jgi:uncharacterized membrane protein
MTIWFLVIHIVALLFWGAGLLYLPVLVTVNQAKKKWLYPPRGRGSIARFIFTNISSPAAAIAIMSGTVVFFLEKIVAFWLIAKLSLVTGLVCLHALTGWMLLKLEQQPDKPVFNWCLLLSGALLILMSAIIWIVLAKPTAEMFGLRWE